MTEDMVEIIQRILDGGKEEFSLLVRKYQMGIHALAWKKVGDYHIAEELTQDTFVQAYNKLHTLKNPNQFEGWLYVIADRLCINWTQRNKRKIPVQSIEETPVEEIEKAYHTHYVSELRKQEDIAYKQEIVEKLLAMLPESERKVLTLYYLGGMTTKEISKFLGVSVNTIKSKIRRARNRLKEEGEYLITENLGSVQLSTDLTESIMRQIADIKPTPPIAKPMFPWGAFGTAAVLVMLLLGSIQQYITHFHKPYNFHALSEPTIEIVESPIKIDIVSIPSKRNKIGRGVINSRRDGTGTLVSDDDFAVNVQENTLNSSIERWTQADGPQGSSLFNLFATSENNIHAVSSTGIYRLTEDGTTWMNINASVPMNSFQAPITEHQGILYSVNSNTIFASTNGGETWNRFCYRPDGDVVGLIINSNIQDNFTMYLALKNKGIFRSVNAGRKWISMNNGLTGKRISAVASVGDSVFIGTNRGLYTLKSGIWDQLPIDPLKTVHSMTVFENNLYLVTGPDFLSPEFFEANAPENMSRNIYHSVDSGFTWREITPQDKSFIKRPSFVGPTEISATNKTLLILGIPAFRSIDGGQTWTNLGFNINLLPSIYSSILAVNENTFYKVGPFGILRTTDNGDSWHSFMNGMLKNKVGDLVAFNNILYVYTGTGFFKSVDDGNSWEEVHIDYGDFIPKFTRNVDQIFNYFTNAKLVVANNELYGIVPRGNELYIFRLRSDDGVLLMIHNISSPTLWTEGEDSKGINLTDGDRHTNFGGFAVCNNTFYTEYKRRLFKWIPNGKDVVDIGITDTNIHIDPGVDSGLKLAASAEVIYVGKRDGKLYQSIDRGNSWRDVTLNIPFSFTSIKDIMLIEDHVYVATDKGVMTSQTGEHWRMLTDNIGKNIIIDKFAMYGSNFYGAGDKGVYILDPLGRWEQILSNVPDKVISLSASHDKLYIGTENRGIFHTSLDDGTLDVNVTKRK